MKPLKPRKLTRVHWSLLGLVLSGATSLLKAQTAPRAQTLAPGQTAEVVAPSYTTFYVRSYGGKCLAFNPPPRRPIGGALSEFAGSPVFIDDCNGTVAQQVGVEELPGPGYLVILRAGGGVIGKRISKPGVAREDWAGAQSPTSTPDQTPLEVQPYTDPPGPGQIFALDGDGIILAEGRNLVVEVQNNRGANRTPLVLGRRDLDDSEFWAFAATDGSGKRPTSGFVRVSLPQNDSDIIAFVDTIQVNRPGMVFELDPDVSIDLTNHYPIRIKEGVTIRGDRRGTRPGPELWVREGYSKTMLRIEGSDVRITGLRLRGPNRTNDEDSPLAYGIAFTGDKLLFHRIIIDHNDLSGWTGAAVTVRGFDGGVCQAGDDNPGPPLDLFNVRVARNFIHHNQREEEGYGVETTSGAHTLIEGNTFVSNRHAIAAGGEPRTIYRAWYNLVLSEAPQQHQLVDWYTHDFDMHGTEDKGVGGGRGGTGGQYIEIAWNTFMGMNRNNFKLRGEPCYLAEFHHNVSRRQNHTDAVACSYCGQIDKLRVYDNNRFNASDPTYPLGVGDFDGDGTEDVFLATGAAWYYAPAANAEWRFLNVQTERISSLRFGDFDGDGRTDVFTQHGYNWEVSWGGASKWETINVSAPALEDFAIGDFDGDHRADVFYANGQEWFVSFGGVGMFTHFALATHRVSDLRFGDFNDDGNTDVFGVVGDEWMVVYGGTHYWAPLRAKLRDSVAPLTVADFDGDGRADVVALEIRAGAVGYSWLVSRSGTDDWTALRGEYSRPGPASAVAIGRFDDVPGADLLFWQGNTLNIASGGSGASIPQSRQDMH
jgi:hypothetical protein